MPSDVQIVPKYTFPHEEVYVHDNTSGALEDPVSTAVVYPYLAVFASDRGIDGKLINITSLPKYYKMFGKTNFKKYGQPHLMPEAILSQENTSVWCMRVMPDDATYANAVLSLWYKADEDNKAFRIKFTLKSIGENSPVGSGEPPIKEVLKDRELLSGYAKKFDGTAVEGVYVDSEGYTQVPLALFTAIGRGLYGKDLRFRISPNEDYEKEYGIKVFTFECLNVKNGVTVEATHNASIVSSGNVENTIMINDIIDDTSEENLSMNIEFFEENVESLYDAYVAFCEKMIEADPALDITIPELDKFDPLFGKACKQESVRVTPNEPFIKFTEKLTADVDKDADGFVAADYTETDIISLNDVTGNALANGSDGAFANPDPEERQKAIDACYIKAFNGGYDKLILAPKRIKACALFDACYNMPVKLALAQLALYRASAPLYLDTQLIETLGTTNISTLKSDFAPLDDLIDQYSNFSDAAWIISVNTHDYLIKESSTGKRIPVSITYWLASTDATNRETNGAVSTRQNEFATLSGHIKNSLKPAIAENEGELKQALYDARINYFEDNGDNTFVRATQSMFVHSNSDLLEEPNVIALLELKRILEDEFKANRNCTTSPALRADFRKYILDKYDWMIGSYFQTMDIQYKSNEYESKRKITHVYAAVTFPEVSKVTLIEINVNPRTYVPDEEEE